MGKVKSIELRNRKAHVTLTIKPQYQLGRDVKALIKTAGVLGEKYVEIEPGRSDDYLKDGDEIVSTISPADLDNLMNQLSEIAVDIKAVSESLKKSIGTDEGADNIKAILVNIRDTTKILAEVMESNDEKIGNLFTNLESISYGLDEIIEQNDDKIHSFFTNFEELSASLNDLVQSNNDQISQIVTNLNEFTGELRDISVENRRPFKDMVANLESFSEDLSEKTPEITAQLKTISENPNLIKVKELNIQTNIFKEKQEKLLVHK